MYRIPFTLFPIIAIAIVWYYIPTDGFLISDFADTMLGIIVGASLVICLVLDVIKFTKK